MSIPRIEDVEQPVVGRWYLVPCVWRGDLRRPTWWPVFGGWHSDAEVINFPAWHFHFDARFLSRSQLAIASRYGSPDYALVAVYTELPERREPGPPPETPWRRRRMVRGMPAFPAHYEHGQVKTVLAHNLETAFAGQTMKCRTCPHRGFSLKGLPVKDGAVVCPGHGLKWDLATGAMIPR